MTNEQGPTAGFNKPQTPNDSWVAGLYTKYELPEEASLEDIEPVALGLWSDPHTKLDAIELVLGRRVDAQEFKSDPNLRELFLTTDANLAFGGLLLVRTIEEMAAESPDILK